MSGNTHTVCPQPSLPCKPEGTKNVCSVPYCYVPEKDIAAGPAKIEKDKEDKTGFWLGSIRSRGRSAEAQGYDKGPLQGFVKVKVSDIG